MIHLLSSLAFMLSSDMHTGGPNCPRAEEPEGEERLSVHPGEVAGVPLSIQRDLLFLQIIPLK